MNNLTVTQSGAPGAATVTYADTVAVGVGTGCTRNGPNTVTCPTPGSITITLADQDDQTTLVNVTVSVNQDGGAGNDTLRGPQGFVSSLGGDGNDQLIGSTGAGSGFEFDFDRSDLDGGAGADRFVGGPGADRVDYGGRTAGVTVTLDDQPNDGEAGEGDNLVSSIESVIGGAGPDSLTGGAGNEFLDGRAGNDTVDGGPGDDDLVGGPGTDIIRGGTGVDRASFFESATTPPFAGLDVSVTLDNVANDGPAGANDNVAADVEDIDTDSGNDTIVGSAEFNFLAGNSGNDVIDGAAGSDVLFGGGGDDTLRARRLRRPRGLRLGDGYRDRRHARLGARLLRRSRGRRQCASPRIGRRR